MNIVFFGSDEFAQNHLEYLVRSRHTVLACVTQPDKPKGRGMKMSISPIKEFAIKNGMAVFQPRDLKNEETIKAFKELKGDLFVVIAYGQFLPQAILAIPKICAVNVHSSLLPKYRGAAPVNWAIVKGEKKTGVSVMKINQKMDAGDIFAQKDIPIEPTDDAVTLKERLALIGPPVLLDVIDALENHRASAFPQDEKAVTFAPKLTKELGHIQWDKGANEIYDLIRGLLPWPTAYTFLNGQFLKILSAQVLPLETFDREPGEVVEVEKWGFTVATGAGGLLVKRVHLQSSKPMAAYDFVIGHRLRVGFRF